MSVLLGTSMVAGRDLGKTELLRRAAGIRAVFFDNEGCLVPDKRTAWRLDELGQVAAWLAANEARVQFGLSTGRPVGYAEAVMHAIGRNRTTFPSICEGGAVLFVPATDVVVSPHDAARAERPEHQLAPCVPLDILRGFLEESAEFRSGDTGSRYHFEPGKFCCVSVHPRELSMLGTLEDVIRGGLGKFDVLVTRSSAAVDLTPLGQDKGWAIEQVLSAYDLSWDETMVMGDRLNDVPALERAGIAVCPQACDDEVRALCHVQFDLPSTAAAHAALRMLDGKLPE